MFRYILPTALVLCLIFSCADDTPSVAQLAPEKKSTGNRKIRNGIELNAKDLKVSQAFLLYEDGTLVPESNETSVAKPVKLRLIIDNGWKESSGQIALGASEKIETSDGQTVLDEKDLFQNLSSIAAADAKYITLTANISRLDKLYDYFLVSFRVWDKAGPGEVTGHYKLYIK